MFPSHSAILGLLLVTAGLGAGCASSAPPLPSGITDQARISYYEGVDRLRRGDFTKAADIFQPLSTAPRHVRHATLAKLRLGDTMFFQGRYAEATEIFRTFANQNRGDPNLPYARFRVAESYFRRIPSEWFLSPPAYEMDHTLTQQAEAELTGFLAMFPTSPYAPAVREMLRDTRRMLYEHELYVVDFNRRKRAWQGVAWRLKDAFERFPEFVDDERRVWQMVEANEKVGDREAALHGIGMLVERFPESRRREEALARAEAIRAEAEAELQSKEPLPGLEILDTPPDFRLNRPSFGEGGDALSDGDDDEDDEDDEDDDLEDDDDGDDVESAPRLRPPSLTPLSP